MTYTTTIEKDYSNKLRAETVIDLGECIDDDSGKPAMRVLSVTSSKGRGGITTNASVHILVNERGYEVKKFVMFQDYNKTIATYEGKRVTEKLLTLAHNKALEGIDPILEEAKQQYNILSDLSTTERMEIQGITKTKVKDLPDPVYNFLQGGNTILTGTLKEVNNLLFKLECKQA